MHVTGIHLPVTGVTMSRTAKLVASAAVLLVTLGMSASAASAAPSKINTGASGCCRSVN
jgi:hypothetical protein